MPQHVRNLFEVMALRQFLSGPAMTECVRGHPPTVDARRAQSVLDDRGYRIPIAEGMIGGTTDEKHLRMSAPRPGLLEIVQQALAYGYGQGQHAFLAPFDRPKGQPIPFPLDLV